MTYHTISDNSYSYSDAEHFDNPDVGIRNAVARDVTVPHCLPNSWCIWLLFGNQIFPTFWFRVTSGRCTMSICHRAWAPKICCQHYHILCKFIINHHYYSYHNISTKQSYINQKTVLKHTNFCNSIAQQPIQSIVCCIWYFGRDSISIPTYCFPMIGHNGTAQHGRSTYCHQ